MTPSPPGEFWQRDAELVGVSFPARTIELIVMPLYEQAAPIKVPYAGRMVSETIARGAFDAQHRTPRQQGQGQPRSSP